MNVLTYLLLIPALWLLFVALVPLFIKSVFKKPVESGIRRIDTAVTGLPMEAIPYFESAQTALQTLGFSLEFHLKLDREADLMDAYAVIMSHAANRDLVMILACVAPQKLQQIEFSTEFANGGEVNTNNGPQLPLNVIMKPEKKVFWCPEQQDPAKLYEAHLALCSARGTSKSAVPHGDEILLHVTRGMQQDFDHALRSGVLTIDPAERAYRLTTIGAYRLTIPNLFPFSVMMKRRRREHDRREIRRALGR